METIRIAILDDESSEQERTIGLLKQFALDHKLDIEYIVEGNPHAFLSHDLSSFDLALIDIIMPFDINGFDVSKKIRETNDKISIIFLTKTLNYAINGYEVRALDYLLKPLSYEDFSLKMSIFLKTLQSKGNKEHAFKCQGSLIKVKEKDIIYIDIYEHYLNIHTKNKVHVTRGNIKDIHKELSNIFSRCSNYCIVNFLYLDEIQKDDVLLKNGDYIKITSKYKKQFLKDFSHYLLNNE
jgi:DNA-binding LytR/AlgR family response regulator